MIAINLLPEEFRIKEKKEQKEIPLLKIAAGIGILFAIFTLVFYVDFWLSRSRLKQLEKQWEQVQPQALILNQLQTEVENVLKPENDFLKKYVATSTPVTHRFVWLSEFLPENAWLTEVKMQHDREDNSFVVKGLCLPSKEKSSIEQIEGYLHELKKRMPEYKLSLTTSRQVKDDVELTQFIAIFEGKKPDKGQAK